MTFTIELDGGTIAPVARCDRCGQAAPAEGFVAWDAAVADGVARIACREACLEALTTPSGDWLAVPLDAYLADLIRRLGIDLGAVEQRERAAAAAELTRREGPE